MTIGSIIAIIVSILASVGLSFITGRQLGKNDLIRSEAEKRNDLRDEIEVGTNATGEKIDNARNNTDDIASIRDIANDVIREYDERHRK